MLIVCETKNFEWSYLTEHCLTTHTVSKDYYTVLGYNISKFRQAVLEKIFKGSH